MRECETKELGLFPPSEIINSIHEFRHVTNVLSLTVRTINKIHSIESSSMYETKSILAHPI